MGYTAGTVFRVPGYDKKLRVHAGPDCKTLGKITYVPYLPMLDERLVQILDVDVPVGFVVLHVAHFGAYGTQ
jgi:hypothetical protein